MKVGLKCSGKSFRLAYCFNPGYSGDFGKKSQTQGQPGLCSEFEAILGKNI